MSCGLGCRGLRVGGEDSLIVEALDMRTENAHSLPDRKMHVVSLLKASRS